MVTEGPKYGYVINPNKSRVMLAKTLSKEEKRARIEAYAAAFGITVEECMGSGIFIMHEVDNLEDYGIVLLGNPLGSKEYIMRWLAQKMASLHQEAMEIVSFPDAQSAWLFLFYCLRAKITYITRMQEYDLISSFVEEFDRVLVNTLGKIVGVPLTESAIRQCRLPFKEGGFAMGHTHLSAQCGRIAVCIATTQHMFNDPQYQKLMEGKVTAEGLLEIALQYFRTKVDLPQSHWCNQAVNEILLHHHRSEGVQKDLYGEIIINEIDSFVNEQVPEVERARREAIQGPETGAFLLATPKGDCKFISSYFKSACLLRLGMDQPTTMVSDIKCVCGKDIDSKGSHLMRCKRGGEVIDRHDAVVRTLRQLGARAGTKCSYCPKGCFPIPSTDENGEVKTFGGLTPDLRFQFMGSDGRPVIADIRITDSTCQSQLHCGIDKSEKEKYAKYGAASDTNGLHFIPLVLEVYGRWSKKNDKFRQAVSEDDIRE
jgi:hypothetical protein